MSRYYFCTIASQSDSVDASSRKGLGVSLIVRATVFAGILLLVTAGMLYMCRHRLKARFGPRPNLSTVSFHPQFMSLLTIIYTFSVHWIVKYLVFQIRNKFDC